MESWRLLKLGERNVHYLKQQLYLLISLLSHLSEGREEATVWCRNETMNAFNVKGGEKRTQVHSTRISTSPVSLCYRCRILITLWLLRIFLHSSVFEVLKGLYSLSLAHRNFRFDLSLQKFTFLVAARLFSCCSRLAQIKILHLCLKKYLCNWIRNITSDKQM